MIRMFLSLRGRSVKKGPDIFTREHLKGKSVIWAAEAADWRWSGSIFGSDYSWPLKPRNSSEESSGSSPRRQEVRAGHQRPQFTVQITKFHWRDIFCCFLNTEIRQFLEYRNIKSKRRKSDSALKLLWGHLVDKVWKTQSNGWNHKIVCFCFHFSRLSSSSKSFEAVSTILVFLLSTIEKNLNIGWPYNPWITLF